MGWSSLSPGLWHGLGGWRQGSRCVNRLSWLSPKGSPDIKVAKVVIPNISKYRVYVWWFLKFFLSIPGSMNRFLGSCVLLHPDIYLHLPKGLNFSLTSNISLRRKLKTQAESDFSHILKYSDKILVDDPGEKKCSVGDVRCFFILVFNFYIFFRAETPTKRVKTPTKQAKTPEMRFSCKTVNFFNTVINKFNNISTIYSVSGHLNQTSSKSLKNTIGQKKTPQAKKINSG